MGDMLDKLIEPNKSFTEITSKFFAKLASNSFIKKVADSTPQSNEDDKFCWYCYDNKLDNFKTHRTKDCNIKKERSHKKNSRRFRPRSGNNNNNEKGKSENVSNNPKKHGSDKNQQLALVVRDDRSSSEEAEEEEYMDNVNMTQSNPPTLAISDMPWCEECCNATHSTKNHSKYVSALNNFSKKRKSVQFHSNSDRNSNHNYKKEKITHNASTAIPLIQISRDNNNNSSTTTTTTNLI